MAKALKGQAEAGLRTLYGAGTAVGLSERELLALFLMSGGGSAELAFAALVEWHGPMVLRVCRDVLRESHDADDAFQATFLILARRAGSIRNRSSLGPWLYGVALRVARSSRSRAMRRRKQEQSAAGSGRGEAGSDPDDLDAVPILHEEVGRLPAKYREPLVLCYFEGLTHDQAASQLGWPVGTVRSRMAGARDRLRHRLLRRGVTPSVATLAATGHPAVTVPAILASATVGMAIRAGATGTVPAAVAALVGTVLREMTLVKLSMLASGLVAAALVGTAGVGYVQGTARPQDAAKPVTPKPNETAPGPDALSPAPTAVGPGRDRNNPPVPNLRLGTNSSRVLWARMRTAAEKFRVAKALHAAARGKYDEVIAARGEFEALAVELNTCADDLRDEVELLNAQLKIRGADVRASQAQQAKAAVGLANTQRLAIVKEVSENEVSLFQSDVDIRSAELAKKQAELDEIALRIKQATRRRDEAIAIAKRAEGLDPQDEVPLGQAVPAAK